jgi:hypothetical protein
MNKTQAIVNAAAGAMTVWKTLKTFSKRSQRLRSAAQGHRLRTRGLMLLLVIFAVLHSPFGV